MVSDIHFKMRDGRTDIQCRRTHKHCCFCLDIHRILNLLLEVGHLWLVYFAEWPVGKLGIRLPHSLSWQPPTKAQTEAPVPTLLSRPEGSGPRLSAEISVYRRVLTYTYSTCVFLPPCMWDSSVLFSCTAGLFGQKVVFKPSSGLLQQ